MKVGDLISPLLKSAVTRVQISQFASATNDFGPMHVDEGAAQTKGYSGICAHGQLALAYAEQALKQHPELRIFKITTTFQKLIWPGDLLTAKGIVTKIYQEEDKEMADIDLWVENQNQDLVLKGQANCIIKA